MKIQNKIPGLLLFIDFEKAFGRIEWPFIERTLKYFNFGVALVTWFKLSYTSLVPSRSFFTRCLRLVWERAGESLLVKSQLTIESESPGLTKPRTPGD